jgi:acetyltransferase
MRTKDLSKLFSPKSIALVGASRSHEKVGNIVLRNIVEFGFKGEIYPVNPNVQQLLNLPCFPNVTALPKVPDLGIIVIPAAGVIDVVREFGEKGTKNIIVLSAGFKEASVDGMKLENELVELARNYEINLLGPNCLGMVNTLHHLNATFGAVSKVHGNLRFISQSGAVATSMFDYSATIGLGFSDFVTLGNKANLNDTDILKYWLENPDSSLKNLPDGYSGVAPIGIYAESITDGFDFINTVSRTTLTNPVFILKPGKSNLAKSAMQSHTGSMAGEDKVLESALNSAGVIRCEGMEDFFDLAKAFAWENAPEGNEIVIVSNAGGPAVISTDFIEDAGLRLAEISEATQTRLRKYLPAGASLHNPIDLLGDALADRYAEALDACLGQKNVSGAIVILTPQVMTDSYATARLVSRLSTSHKKPILCAFMGGSHIEAGEKVLNQHKIPNFRFPERAIKAMGHMYGWRQNSIRRSIEIQNLNSNSLKNSSEINTANISQVLTIASKNADGLITPNKKALSSFMVEEILREANINCPPSSPVQSFTECLDFTKQNGWPVVLKIISPYLLHKSDIGGVKANLNNRAKLEQAFKDIQKVIDSISDEKIRKTCSIQIQKQCPKGIELIIGVKRDTVFGHAMVFGAGGVFAELIKDVNIKLLPVDRLTAAEFIKKSLAYPLLTGFRGDKEYAITKLCFLMEKLSDLVLNFPEFEEIEINPAIITYDEIYAVDGKAIIAVS